MSRVNCIISIPINGSTHRITLLNRKLATSGSKLIKSLGKYFLSRICEYAVASTEYAAFIIGGYDQSSIGINIIAKFQDNQWTRYESLKASRRLHGSIQNGDLTMIIGGDSTA